MKQNVQTLKGFRDFLPEEKRKRDFVMASMIQTFELFGFQPLETPTLEYASLLTGKYGEEADRLVYTFEDKGKRKVGLRFDQTVPTARVLAEHKETLPKYFRRYQMQPVFRAEKPQKGRYREFIQSDIDIFGSLEQTADAEILACTYETLKNIGFSNLTLVVNDRETLISTLSPFATESVSVYSIIQTIDKLEKISDSGVVKELESKGLSSENAQKALDSIQNAKQSETLAAILEQTKALGVPESALEFCPTIARGLDYYTGMIFEIVSKDYTAGSLGGGGRYDKLIKQLGGVDKPGVGMAFGFDRIVEAASELGLLDNIDFIGNTLVTVFDPSLRSKSSKIARKLRSMGIVTELYVGKEPIGKQLSYASANSFSLAVIIGPDEAKDNTVVVKDLTSKTQETVKYDDLESVFGLDGLQACTPCDNSEEDCSCGDRCCESQERCCDKDSCKCQGKECTCSKGGICTCQQD